MGLASTAATSVRSTLVQCCEHPHGCCQTAAQTVLPASHAVPLQASPHIAQLAAGTLPPPPASACDRLAAPAAQLSPGLRQGYNSPSTFHASLILAFLWRPPKSTATPCSTRIAAQPNMHMLPVQHPQGILPCRSDPVPSARRAPLPARSVGSFVCSRRRRFGHMSVFRFRLTKPPDCGALEAARSRAPAE